MSVSISECTAEYAVSTGVLVISVESVLNERRIDALPPRNGRSSGGMLRKYVNLPSLSFFTNGNSAFRLGTRGF